MDKRLGFIADKYETGGNGPRTIGRTKGDHGGASYGTYQLSSKTGTLTTFLSWAGEKNHPPVATKAFDDWWLNNADRLDNEAHEFIKATHYEPMRGKLKAIGENSVGFPKRWAAGVVESRALEELIFSTSVQYGAKSGILTDIFAGLNKTFNIPDREDQFVSQCCYKKFISVDQYFKSSSHAVKTGVKDRNVREWADYCGVMGWDIPSIIAGDSYRTYKAGTKEHDMAEKMLFLLESETPAKTIKEFQELSLPYAQMGFKATGDLDKDTALNILQRAMFAMARGKLGIAIAKA